MKTYTLHSVADNGLSLKPDLFRKFIRYIQRTNHFLSPSDLSNGGKENGVLLTFDDCYADNFSNALPILDEFGVKALFFFTPGYLGTVRWGSRGLGKWADTRSDEYNIPFGFMGLQELNTLIELGHDVGFHSRTHCNLDQCSELELEDEILIAKHEWEDRLGHSFTSFAYPRGRFDSRMFPIIKSAGYCWAFSTQVGNADSAAFASNPFCLPRFPIQRRGLFGWL